MGEVIAMQRDPETERIEGLKEQFPAIADAIDAACAQHGEDLVGALAVKGGGLIVCRAATRGEWQRFKAEVHNDKKKADADEHLTRSCVVHPDKKTFDAMLDKRPGIVAPIMAVITELTGTQEVERGKS